MILNNRKGLSNSLFIIFTSFFFNIIFDYVSLTRFAQILYHKMNYKKRAPVLGAPFIVNTTAFTQAITKSLLGTDEPFKMPIAVEAAFSSRPINGDVRTHLLLSSRGKSFKDLSSSIITKS